MEGTVKFFESRYFKALLATVVGTVIYCCAVVWILSLADFYAGGVTGVSQLVLAVFNIFDIDFSISFLILLFNIPLFLIGWKHVSKRFTYLSLLSVFLQVVVIYFLEYLLTLGFNPLAPLANDKLLLAIIGGLIMGLGLGITLRFGSSTGGLDILSQYMELKHDVSFVNFSLLIDIIIIVLGALIGGSIEIAIYTMIRLLVHMITLDKIHTIYRYMKVTIYTTKKDEMCKALIERFNHGVTIYQVIGGYTQQERWVLESVCSSYETEDYRRIALSVDEKVFITYSSVYGIEGFFNRNVIN